MRAFVAVCLMAVASADQTASASGGYGSVPAPVPAHGYQAGAGRPQGRPQGGVRGGAPAGGRAGYVASPGGFKTPVGTAGYQPEYHYEPSPYAFDYAVNNYDSGAQYSANENSDGKQTTGFYTVALPDGRIQTVKYTVDDYGGFNAEVSYEGEASYPEPSAYAAPAVGGYKPGPSVGYKPVVKSPPVYKASPAYRPAPIFKSSAPPSYKAPAASYAAVVPTTKYAAE